MSTVTYEQAIAGAARVLAEGIRVRDSLSVEDAARAALRAGGPSYEELVAMIRAQRGLPVSEAA